MFIKKNMVDYLIAQNALGLITQKLICGKLQFKIFDQIYFFKQIFNTNVFHKTNSFSLV